MTSPIRKKMGDFFLQNVVNKSSSGAMTTLENTTFNTLEYLGQEEIPCLRGLWDLKTRD